MVNTLLDAQTDISNDTLRELVVASVFIGESPNPPVYTHATYGTLVGSFSTAWNPTATTISFTESNPQPEDDDVIMSDANFQTVRTNATAGRVFYVWGSGSALTYYREFIRSEIESANVRAAPTTTINPNNFGTSAGASPDNDFRVHFWNETTGATMTGADYSLMGFANTPSSKTLEISNFSSVDYVGTNYTSPQTYAGEEYITIQIDYLHIFYK